MYVIMSFFPTLYPLNIILGAIGGTLFLVWSLRVNNRPQQLVNATGVLVCVLGLVKVWS
jgi:hypothetical protein